MQRIGVITSGGDAPGMNAVIRAVVRAAIYHGLEVIGIEEGYVGLLANKMRPLDTHSVSGIIHKGGTILKTLRCKEIRTDQGIEKAAKILKKNNIEGLIVIGGEGSFKAAYRIHNVSEIPIMGIPASIDNDIPRTDETIGFDTAVNTALEALDRVRDTAESHERVFIVEIMGKKRGFLALEVGLAGGADIILIPEIPYEMEDLCQRIREMKQKGKMSCIVVMAEGFGDCREIAARIQDNVDIEVRLTVLGYIQRGGSPTADSRILASRLGAKAVELLLNGEKSKMVGLREREIIPVDMEFVYKEKKPINEDLYNLAKMLAY